MNPRVLMIKLAHDNTHPFDPNVIEYDTFRIVDGETEYNPADCISGVRVSIVINETTVWGTVQAAARADAIAHGWLDA